MTLMVITDEDESRFATIPLLKGTLSNVEEALDFVTMGNVSISKGRMLALCHQLRYVTSPMINLPQKGSTSELQQNVTLNPFGNKRSSSCYAIPFKDIGCAPTDKDKSTRRIV